MFVDVSVLVLMAHCQSQVWGNDVKPTFPPAWIMTTGDFPQPYALEIFAPVDEGGGISGESRPLFVLGAEALGKREGCKN